MDSEVQREGKLPIPTSHISNWSRTMIANISDDRLPSDEDGVLLRITAANKMQYYLSLRESSSRWQAYIIEDFRFWFERAPHLDELKSGRLKSRGIATSLNFIP